VIILRQALLQKEVDYLLEVGANGMNGFISPDMTAASKARLQERGFEPNDLEYTVTTTSGVNGRDIAMPVMRGVGIGLQLTYPYHRLFIIDQLVGLSIPSSTARMGASGMKMSEYVP
jgi:hypothetical protein